MVLYGLPDGASESTRNNKDPDGIVCGLGNKRHVNQASPGKATAVVGVCWRSLHLLCYARAEAGVTLPPISFCSFETLFPFGSFDHYAACFVFFFFFSIIRHPVSNNVDVTQLMEDGENTLRVL